MGGWHKGHGDEDHSRFRGFFGKKETPPIHEGPDGRDAFSEFWDKQGREAFKSYLNSRQGDAK